MKEIVRRRFMQMAGGVAAAPMLTTFAFAQSYPHTEIIVIDDVSKEILPTDAIWIDVIALIGDLVPVGAVVDAKIAARIEVLNGWRIRRALGPAAVQSGNRRTARAVDLKAQKIIATDACCPRANDGSDSTALELDQCP